MKKTSPRKSFPAGRARAPLPVTVCAATLLMLAGCASSSHGDFCTLYLPVYTSLQDTAETRRQADMNNAVWETLCDENYAP